MRKISDLINKKLKIKGSKNLFKVEEKVGDKYKVYIYYKKERAIVTREQVLSGEIGEDYESDRAQSTHSKLTRKETIKTVWSPTIRIDEFTTVLFLDASTENTGYTVLEDGGIDRVGTIKSTDGRSREFRIDQMKKGLISLLSEYPDTKLIVIEDIYLEKYIESFTALAELRGVLQNIAFNNDIHFQTIRTSTYRSPYGMASMRREKVKDAVQSYVRSRGIKFANEDEADSIMICLFIMDYFLKK